MISPGFGLANARAALIAGLCLALPAAAQMAAGPAQAQGSDKADALQKRDDVIESAIERALEQSAEVVVVRHHQDLEALGSIGAVLRY